MVTIRLAMRGAKKRPFYLVVASDSRKRRDSGYIERLGYFNPRARDHETRLALDRERYDYWLGQGAKPSERVAALARSNPLRPEAEAEAETKVEAEAEVVSEAEIDPEAEAASEAASEDRAETKAEAQSQTPETLEAAEVLDPAASPESAKPAESTEAGKSKSAESSETAAAQTP